MIKLDTKNWKVETDCKTVGDFMTEAAELSVGNVTIIVDGCRYEFHGAPKISVTDNTPIDEITYSSLPGIVTFIVKTKPKPKTVKKSGWINIYDFDGGRITGCGVFKTEAVAKSARSHDGRPKVATIRVEWEEETE